MGVIMRPHRRIKRIEITLFMQPSLQFRFTRDSQKEMSRQCENKEENRKETAQYC